MMGAVLSTLLGLVLIAGPLSLSWFVGREIDRRTNPPAWQWRGPASLFLNTFLGMFFVGWGVIAIWGAYVLGAWVLAALGASR